MSNEAGSPSILQICVTCRTQEDLLAPMADNESEAKRSGQRLYERLLDQKDALGADIEIQAVECMNGCQSACTASLQAAGKYSFLIGNLDDSDERVQDLLSFANAHAEADTGLPAWRDRPVHVRKNTLARLHPMALPSSASSTPGDAN